MRSALKCLWILSIVFLAWQGFSSYSRLPGKLATHFDMSGNPDGWSSKRSFFIMWYVFMLGLNLIWLLSVVLIPVFMTRRKLAWTVSIPNKEYWLATDERIQECVGHMKTMLFGVSFLTNMMMAVIYHIIVQSNIETRVRAGMWWIFFFAGIMLVFTFVYLFTAFRRPKEE